jgi:hypothetical protein
MLRVFKPTSPMSMGTWILSAFGSATGVAVVSEVLDLFPRVGRLAGAISALLGPALSTYKAVLIADTSVPVWHEARRELPMVFAASSAASAGAAAVILTPPEDAGPARRLAIGGVLLEIGAVETMKRRLGDFLAEPYRRGEGGRFEMASKALSGLGAVVIGFAGPRRSAATLGGTLILAGAALERWSIFRAGFESARDPKYTVMPQRERLRGPDEAGESR